MDINGASAIVTGGASGIGAAIAARLLAGGAQVAALDLNPDAVAEGLLAVRCDVSDDASVRAAVDEVVDRLGGLDVVINNAGIGAAGTVADNSDEEWHRVLDVNVLGTLLWTQEAVRRWRAAGRGGAVVNISSIAATLGAAHEYVHYAAAKAAVETFTLGLAREVAASGTRINAVAPGTVLTDIHAAAGDPGRPDRVVARVPMGRIGEPEEIAAAVLWLLLDEASYVTGAVLRASGGV